MHVLFPYGYEEEKTALHKRDAIQALLRALLLALLAIPQ